MQRQKITLVTDVPMQMQMEQVFGTEKSSTVNGVEYRYNVTQGNQPCVIYLTADGRDAILRAGLQIGDTAELLRQRRGGQSVISARRIGDAAEPARPLPIRDEHANGYANGNGHTNGNGYTNGNGHTNGVRMLAPRMQVAAPQPQPVPQQTVPTSHPIQERMSRMFIVAGRSLRDAHEQLLADPFFLKLEPPTWEDIRATAIHWAISVEKKEGR